MVNYHLWIVPRGAVFERLERTIQELSDRYHTPPFPPHVTLLGHLPGSESHILRSSARLAKRLRVHDIRLQGPGMSPEYFQCLFLHVERTLAVTKAHAEAVQVFSILGSASYAPHLSLMYGTVSDTLKRQIATSLPQDLPVQFPADRLWVIRAESDNPRDWRRIRSLRFDAGEGHD